MSRVEDLIQTLCPDGVEYVTLGDISIIDSSGVDKKIVSGEKIIFLLNYMDVYRNSFIDKSVITMQVTASDKKIASCDIQQGDIFITPTSETIEDLAHSAVAIETIEEAVYSYHIMRIRLKKKSMITSYYLNYLFRSEFLQNQIMHYASGLTRFGLSRAKWLSLIIPLPPLPVQEEIVRILDTFSGVVTELEAEQAARARQYEHYRNELMSFESKSKIMENLLADFCPDGVEYLELQQIFDYRNGYTPSRNEDENWNDGTISWFTLKDLRKNGGILSESIEKITSKGVKRELFEANSIIISTLATIGEHALILNNALANQQMTCLTRKEEYKEFLTPKFVYYYCFLLGQWCRENVNVSGFASVDMGRFARFKFPIPPLEVQEQIVSILDRFDTLVNDLKSGLPAEIALRRKQYEYYRDKLLTFHPLS